MSVGQLGQTLWAANAGVDLTGKVFHFAALDPNTGNIVLPTFDGEVVIGVIYEEATPGNPATVQLDAIAKVVCGSTVHPNDRVASDANGAAAIADHNDFEIGTALTGGVAGEVISVMIATGRARA